jgi:hypothetical protein
MYILYGVHFFKERDVVYDFIIICINLLTVVNVAAGTSGW